MASSGGGSSGGGFGGRRMDLFLSYAWGAGGARKARAHGVAADLRAAGFSVWLDVEQMAEAAASSSPDDASAQGIARASAVVVLLSADYAASRACKKEALFARDAKKPHFFVNVGDGGWTPKAFDHEDEDAVASGAWLSMFVSDALWADARSDAAWAGAGGRAILLRALTADARVSGGAAARAALVAAPPPPMGTFFPPPPPPPPAYAAMPPPPPSPRVGALELHAPLLADEGSERQTGKVELVYVCCGVERTPRQCCCCACCACLLPLLLLGVGLTMYLLCIWCIIGPNPLNTCAPPQNPTG